MNNLVKTDGLERNLDGVFFRAKDENGKWNSVCFTDLSEQSQKDATNERTNEWLQSLVLSLANSLRTIGDEFDISGK